MTKFIADISPSELLSMFIYNAETGEIIRKSDGKIAGSPNNKGYWSICINYKLYKSHRIAWAMMTGEWPKKQIDHINLNRSDNSWKNLRLADNSQNNANNNRVRSNTGVKGVTLLMSGSSKGKYYAQIVVRNKHIYLGLFNTLEEASRAYKEASVKYFGEFARTA